MQFIAKRDKKGTGWGLQSRCCVSGEFGHSQWDCGKGKDKEWSKGVCDYGKDGQLRQGVRDSYNGKGEVGQRRDAESMFRVQVYGSSVERLPKEPHNLKCGRLGA